MKVFLATGRRKTSTAQVRLISPGSGKIVINKRSFEEYFPVAINRQEAIKALALTDYDGKFDVAVTVRGGGKSGQTGAMQLGIARALVEYDAELRSSLRQGGLMTRDPRMVERKKYGQKKARKRFQFSKR
ncbi:MAG: 30S ribosomal protein S9 [Candidatus Kapabacteria bacterium]|nr:30S ribosomal protein S9 [Ignavibacteriota bacterium]MCW5883952.1 30S ribosomal protein S9 [Candidatus Kapabacteria bacterium]